MPTCWHCQLSTPLLSNSRLRRGKGGVIVSRLAVEGVEGTVRRKTEGHVFGKQAPMAELVEVRRCDMRPSEQPWQDQIEDSPLGEHAASPHPKDPLVAQVSEPDPP